MKTVYSIAIVDDHLLFSQALKNLINTFSNSRVLYHVKNGMELIKKLEQRENIPDIALMDINMPLMNGIETTQWLSVNFPEVSTIGLSMDGTKDTVVQMLQAGAKGYLLKDIEPTVLEDAFEEVKAKGFHYSDLVMNTIRNSFQQNLEPACKLRNREIEFLKLVCTEKTYKEIASDMYVSPKTIDGYRESLFEKLHIRSRVGLAVYAIKNKIYMIE